MAATRPRGIHRLTATGVKSIKRPGWHGDGAGLYLEVDPGGAKRWALRLTVNGTRRDFGLGSTETVTLQGARERAADFREKARDGLVPGAYKGRATETPTGPAVTFKDACDEVHQIRKGQWRNGKHVNQWINSLRDYAFPIVGDKPIGAVTTADVLSVLTKIWTSKPETARRVRQRMRTVLDWARAAGLRSGDNPVDLIGEALPRHRRKVEHHPALPYGEVAAFLQRLRCGDSANITKLAFEFLILTAARTIEVRFACWHEIDFDAKLWTLSPDRMKAEREHVVPLSERAIEILRQVHGPEYGPADRIFPDEATGKTMSENRFLNARDGIGYGERCTPHGFRSSFRDWAAEETMFAPEVAEMALAHAIEDKTEAAYRRGELLAKRRVLMSAWASYISTVIK